MKYLLSTAAALALTLGVGVQAANAQAVYPVTHFGLAGGATVPTGDFNSAVNTGWNAMALLAFQMPASPLGLRIDAAYSHLNGQNPADISHSRIWSGTVDATLGANNLMVTPYVIGGVGLYNMKTFGGGSTVTVSPPGETGSVTKFGWNLGGGLQFHTTGGATIFTEARFTSVLTNGGHTNFVPVELGVMFP